MNFKIWLLTTSLFVSACSKNGTPIQSHDGPTNTQVRTSDMQKTAVESKLEQIDAKKVRTEMTASLEGIESQVKKLSEFLLDPSNLRDEKSVASPKFLDLLQLFNWGLIQLHKQKKTAFESYSALYKKTILSGCDSTLKSCEFLNVFKKDNQTTDILILISHSTTAIGEYYQLLHVAIEISPRIISESLKISYLKRAEEYSQFLKSDSQLKDLLAKHDGTLRILLDGSNGATQAHAKNVNPWSYTKQIGANGHANFQFLKQAITSKSDKGDSLLKEFLTKENSSADSFHSRQTISKKDHSKAWTLLQVDSADTTTLEFYIVDRVFDGHLTTAEATELSQHLNLAPEKLGEVAEKYLRVSFIMKMLNTNQLMAGALSDSFELKNFIEQISQKGSEVGLIWKLFLGSTEKLDNYLKSLISQQRRFEPSLKKVLNDISHIKHNIKVYSLYPHMLMAGFYMAKNKINHTIRFLFMEFTFTPDTLLRMMITGKMSPWFDYGLTHGNNISDNQSINRFDMMKSFEISLKSGLFDAFKIDHAEFISQILTNYYSIHIDGISLQELGLSGGSNALAVVNKKVIEWPELLEICQNFKAGQMPTMSQNIMTLDSAPAFANIFEKSRSPFMDVSGFTYGLSPFSYFGSRLLENVRSGVNPNLNYGRILSEIYSEYLKQTDLDEATKRKKLALVNRPIVALESATKDFVDNYSKIYDQYSSCYPQFQKATRQIHFHAARGIEKVAREIYKHHKQNKSSTLSHVRGLTTSLPYTSKATLTGSTLTLYSFDFYILAKKAIEAKFPTLNYQVPNMLESQGVVSNAQNAAYNFSLDQTEDDFVQAVMIAAFGINDSGGVFQWYKSFGEIYSAFPYWRETAVILHLLNPEKYPVKHLIDTMENFLLMANLTDEEEKLFDLTGRRILGVNDSSYGSVYDIKGLLYDSSRLSPIGLMDRVAELALRDVLGSYDTVPSDSQAVSRSRDSIPDHIQPVTLAAIEFAHHRRENRSLLFSAASKIDASFESYFKKGIASWKSSIETLMTLGQNQSNKVEFRFYTPEKTTTDFMSSAAQDDVKKRMDGFHKETEGYYR